MTKLITHEGIANDSNDNADDSMRLQMLTERKQMFCWIMGKFLLKQMLIEIVIFPIISRESNTSKYMQK